MNHVYADPVPVVCVRLSDEAVAALEAQAAAKGMDRSSWLRNVLLARLGLPTGSVEAITPPPAATVNPLVPGDRIQVVDPETSFR